MTFDKVAAIVADYKGIDVADIKEDSAFTDLGLDSLDMAELAMNLEDEFGVTIELDASLKTVADIVKLIDEAK
ncbi:MAG: acyl carrier protein [Christensenellales bacterium]|jgi:acyl carrier protein|nr:acyl carrier protein [Clostridiales bacterium]MDY4200920.1 acyl carrier protein [Candidatus Fimadaptatus sp.]